ncbi:MAG TPA: hypothetical protein VJP02_03785 [Candidatus Sulfotelmatobacter sp.]|nr:hypothetical protein [Candidatus Sulfotelmatobacter sp.]
MKKKKQTLEYTDVGGAVRISIEQESSGRIALTLETPAPDAGLRISRLVSLPKEIATELSEAIRSAN